MYVSQAASKDLNMPFPIGPFKQGRDEAIADPPPQQQQQPQFSSGLLRFRSAPTTLLGEMCEEMLPHRSSSPETESLLARFMSPEIREHMEAKPSAAAERRNSPYMNTVSHEAMEPFQQPSGGGFPPSTTSQLFHVQQSQIHRHSSSAAAADESSYRVAVDDEKGKNGMNSSNLIRHSSSPPGFFSQLGVDMNGYESMRGMSGFRLGSDSAGEAALSGGRLKGQISFSARPSSSSLMPHISELGGESLGGNVPVEGDLRHGNGASRSYIPGFPVAAWEDPPLLSHGFSGLKRHRDSSSEPHNGDARNAFPSLSPHFSLPKTSSEMAAVLRFQDAVPCKIRAKRGCATHPRSIAERVRRTRISERMRKLQELVPNMDKQTNTADMLDLAVDYIKDLQKQVKSLSESRASCICASQQKP